MNSDELNIKLFLFLLLFMGVDLAGDSGD